MRLWPASPMSWTNHSYLLLWGLVKTKLLNKYKTLTNLKHTEPGVKCYHRQPAGDVRWQELYFGSRWNTVYAMYNNLMQLRLFLCMSQPWNPINNKAMTILKWVLSHTVSIKGCVSCLRKFSLLIINSFVYFGRLDVDR